MAKNMSRGRGNDRNFRDRNSESRDFNSSFGGGFNSGSRPMNRQSFKGVCSECGADCDLPFKPVEGRPVYCRDCFQKHKK